MPYLLGREREGQMGGWNCRRSNGSSSGSHGVGRMSSGELFGSCAHCGNFVSLGIVITRNFSIVHRKVSHYCDWHCVKNDIQQAEGVV